MFNIQKAVSRLPFAPKLKEIEVTDITKGLAVFTPLADKPVSFASVKGNLKQAGYTLASADITIDGKVTQEGNDWFITSTSSGQKFALRGKNIATLTSSLNSSVEITGLWTTVGTGAAAVEVVDPQVVNSNGAPASVARLVRYIPASFVRPAFAPEAKPAGSKPAAPIRTTSPGLTVFKGGAVTPRFYLIKQHWGSLDVWRQAADVSVSYTPSPHVQLEIEVPISRTSFNNGVQGGSGTGLGNITVWAKYRFFRVVKTYGDRQASARFGLELPTGSKSFPTAAQLAAPGFVRAQLGSVNGGISPIGDVSFSQAGGRFIFGGDVQGMYRTERNGFRMGHELKVNTDLEYVLFPRKYVKPGGEIFAILETNLITRGKGRFGGSSVPGSSSTDFYVSPGVQWAARPQFVVEGSVQFPVWRNDGALVVRTDLNLLLGVKFLF